jgi:four helix bundle protein
MARDFRSIKAWERAHALTLDIYKATADFPKFELYGLTSQMRRASSSIPINIAEGCGRSSIPELGRFLDYASGSSTELEYELLLGRDLGYLRPDRYLPLTTEVVEIRRMILAFASRLKSDQQRP